MKRALFSVLLLASNLAHAELPTALAEALARPIARLAFGASGDARFLAQRMLGEEGIVLRTYNADAWRAQSRDIVSALHRQPGGEAAAEELYLRILKLEDRYVSKIGHEPGPGPELAAEELLTIQALATEELALRDTRLIEFVAPRSTGRAIRDTFLAGGRDSAFRRAIASLKELAQRPDVAYMLIRTTEGSATVRTILGPGTHLFRGDPALEVIAALEADPLKKDIAIELAYRMNRAVGGVEHVEAKYGKLPKRGDYRQAVLKKIAREYLKPRGA